MKADEIRQAQAVLLNKVSLAEHFANDIYWSHWSQVAQLEIAAQLADLNENIKKLAGEEKSIFERVFGR